jgi:hypothetical protein
MPKHLFGYLPLFQLKIVLFTIYQNSMIMLHLPFYVEISSLLTMKDFLMIHDALTVKDLI